MGACVLRLQIEVPKEARRGGVTIESDEEGGSQAKLAEPQRHAETETAGAAKSQKTATAKA